MRFLALLLIGAALGLGGVALAGPAGVLDPWANAPADTSAWFEPETNVTASKPLDAEVMDPWAPRIETPAALAADRRVDVFPLDRANAASPQVEVLDPWAPPVVSNEMPSLALAAEPRSASSRVPWSGRMIEIIDPWNRMPEWTASERVRLIVDPWGR